MTLWGFELKKMLFTQKGLWILLACLIFKLLFLFFVPEQKDERILLSQKQYDKYLEQLHGENTPEKSAFIRQEYADCLETIQKQEEMRRIYQKGELSEEDWQQYLEKLDKAYLHRNAAQMFAEKEEQFAQQTTENPPAHYIYEYGWQTVFTLQMFPDLFLLFGVLLLSAQCFAMEETGGVLAVLISARNGRSPLFRAKLSALLSVSFIAALLSSTMEAVVFWQRGFGNDPAVPLYSITLFKECPLNIALGQGYLLCLGVRICATLLLSGVVFGLSVWMKNAMNILAFALCILLLPLLMEGLCGAGILFTHMGLLCGSRMLLHLGSSGLPWVLPLLTTAVYSTVFVFAAGKRHQKGL